MCEYSARKCVTVCLIALLLVFLPVYANAQNFVGSFTDLLAANTVDVHLVRFQGTLYGVFTDRRSSGECRRLEAVRMVNETVSPFQICPFYSALSYNVWFDVEALNSQGQWEQIGVLDVCRIATPAEQYSFQLAYVGLNQVNIAMRDRSSLDLSQFVALPICN